MKNASEKVEKILGRYLLSVETCEGVDVREVEKNDELPEYLPSELFTKQTVQYSENASLISLVRIEKVKKLVKENKKDESMGVWLNPISGGF
ncbi:unnamed protein product [Meloidogyne enterolobii]|uniref:Uncharacterized protein n=1 Tax=Meloidogyne enterolobii TaxID=390850 RepID=A0ACB1AC22_MELEN